ncbi:RNA polymerase III RPC4-domain-containing protein [Xylariales sp. AK1849]|nr:RNA polymerase III RPC4-domain-containing protein [Xylariales sp. AK1849]
MVPPRGGTRGGRGVRAGRGGRGASATAASAARTSIEEATPVAASEATGAGHVFASDMPLAAPVQRAITIDSRQSETQSPPAAPAARSRFKPKNVRRDEAERKKLQEDRDRDLAAKIKVEEKEQRDADRRARRGGRGRGRGDHVQHFNRRTVTGGGVFSGISQDMVKRGGGFRGQGSDAVGGPSGPPGVKLQYGPRYVNRREHDVRVNVDTLRDSAAPESSLGASKSTGVLPVGIVRVEHEEDEVKVATTAELEAEEQEDDDDDLFVSTQARGMGDIEMQDDNEYWHAAPKKPEAEEVKEPQVKAEPGNEEDGMDIDSIPANVKAPRSPELKKKPMIQDLETDSRAKAKERRREKALHDPELQAMTRDTQALLDGLSIKEPTEGQEPFNAMDDKLFLFQFPPILPPLLHLNADGNEVVELDDGNEVSGVRVKTEPAAPAPLSINSALSSGGGHIGKLNVRKSGKVELDWGGRILDIGIATDTDFLTTAIMVDEQESDMSSGQGKATGMGAIFGKFVATPIFQEEDDWNPDLEALGLEV